MARIVIALGSNLGDRLDYLKQAKHLLTGISDEPLVYSSIYETEPLGPSDQMYYNAVALMHSEQPPLELLDQFKQFEIDCGRDPGAQKWSDRKIDIDMIDYEGTTLSSDRLVLPHPSYYKRKFVLVPLAEVCPSWIDPITNSPIDKLIENADDLGVFKTSLKW